MKDFITLALLACIAVGKGDDGHVTVLKESARDDQQIKPVEPDMSEFPDEWTNPCGDASECRAAPPSPSWSSIARFSPHFWRWWRWCMQNPNECRMVRGYCRMQTNPAYPTTYPHGQVQLIEFHASGGLSSPVFMWTWMQNLPYFPYKRYGYSINERRWNYRDCCSAGRHLQSPGQTHGWNNSPASFNHHIGNLWQISGNAVGSAWQFQYAERPSFTGSYSIFGKTMVVYERPDDHGFGTPYTWDSQEYGSTGQRLACCEIKRFWIDWEVQDDQKQVEEASRGRGLADEFGGDQVDVFTVDQYRELFGSEPERLPGDPGFIDQN